MELGEQSSPQEMSKRLEHALRRKVTGQRSEKRPWDPVLYCLVRRHPEDDLEQSYRYIESVVVSMIRPLEPIKERSRGATQKSYLVMHSKQ